MKRFVLLVDDATQEQQNAVTSHFRNKPQGFWHIFSDAWLLMDPTEALTVYSLRDQLKSLVPGATTLVLPIDNAVNWAGFGKTESFKWLNDTWPKGAP
jgi:hypothetical protein